MICDKKKLIPKVVYFINNLLILTYNTKTSVI